MLRQHSFMHDGLTITIHARTGLDEMAQEVIYAHITDYALIVPTVKWHQATTYSQIVTQTDSIEGDADFKLPSEMAEPAEHKAFYGEFMMRTDGLIKAYRKALDTVDAAPTKPANADPKGEAASSAKPTSRSRTSSRKST